MRDLSPFFREVRVVRHSFMGQQARTNGAMFSLFAVIVDALHLPQLVEWLNAKITR